MFLLGSGRLERAAKDFYLRIMTDADNKLVQKLDSISTVNKLTEDISRLTIQKSQIEEGFARERREIEHKLGLEKNRQAQELEFAKREATLKADEKFLDQKKTLFETEMKFTREQFTNQVDYLKNMVAQVLERLPDAKIIGTFGDGHKSGKGSK